MSLDPLSAQARDLLSRVVVIGNAKGGVAKTSLAVHVAGISAEAGWRVLLIDMDPQGSCGHALVPGWPNGEGRLTSDRGAAIRKAVDGGEPLVPYIREVRTNLDLACGGPDLKRLADTIIGSAARGRVDHSGLARSLAPIAHEYDLIVIDTPPSNSHLLQLALQAARWLVIPTKSDRFSIDGLNEITEEFLHARSINESLALLGVALVATGTAAKKVRENALEDIASVFGGAAPVFERSTRLAEAPSNEIPRQGRLANEISMADKQNPVNVFEVLRTGEAMPRVVKSMSALAQDYALLVQEILDAIAKAEAEADAADIDMAGAR